MKKVLIGTIMCLFLLTGIPNHILSGSNRGNAYGLTKQHLDDYFTQLESAKRFSGSVLVAKRGKIVFQHGYGKTDYERNIDNKAGTVYSIASLTKAFTAMSVMILAERGQLRLSDTVATYIPAIRGGEQVTLTHLLSQSSGLFDYLYNGELWANFDRYHAPEDLLPYYMNEGLQFEPGSRFEYCNSNYVTLGIVVERVSGMPFREFLALNILEPLKMRHTGYDPENLDCVEKALGYDDITTDPPFRNIFTLYFHPSIAYAAGAMYGTVGDLYKWDQALYTEKLVSTRSLQKIFTPGHGNYGFGWYVDEVEVLGKRYKQAWHWGDYFGFHGYISRLTEEKVTVILLLNTSSFTGTPGELKPLVQEILETILGDNHS